MTPRPKTPGGGTPDGRSPDGGSTPDGSSPAAPSKKHGSIDASKSVTGAQTTTAEVAAAGRAGGGSGTPNTPNTPGTPGRPHLDQATADQIVNTPKGQRPDPKSYLSQADIDAHLQPFRDSGAIRFTDRNSVNQYGTLGPPGGTFTLPKSEFDALLQRSGGDYGKVETELGLDPGTLTNGNTVVAYIAPKDLQNLRMPDGNEMGANQHWVPGGYTSGGVPEATVDTPAGTPYKEIKLP